MPSGVSDEHWLIRTLRTTGKAASRAATNWLHACSGRMPAGTMSISTLNLYVAEGSSSSITAPGANVTSSSLFIAGPLADGLGRSIVAGRRASANGLSGDGQVADRP